MYILSIIKDIFRILSPKVKGKFFFLQILYILSAIIQAAGIASIAPFIGIISKPEVIHANAAFKYLYDLFSFDTDMEFIVAFACMTISMIFLSNTVSIITIWITTKFTIKTGGELQSKLFHIFLSKEYLFHKSTNYNQCIATVTQELPRFVYMVLHPYLLMCSNAFMAAVILIGLLILDPIIALTAFFVIGGSYVVTFYCIKRNLIRHGKIVTEKHETIQSILSESFIGIKEIKLSSLENKYSDLYKNANLLNLNSSSFITLAGDLPRFVIETISFGALLIFAIFILSTEGNSGNAVFVLSIYALAGYKLLPTMQQLYKSVSSISANGVVVPPLRELFAIEPPVCIHSGTRPLSSISTITLKRISYRYPTSPRNVLDGITLVFKKGNLNTIAGPSGSGKSTLADIVLGLLKPDSGEILADEALLTGDFMMSYQRSIGYVPQHIFILDDTVVANIAFGVAKNDIDMAKVLFSLKKANADGFVSDLPDGVYTQLGQDGKLLSGGQRQRIGVARSLYRDNKILIFDEPTSALDIESEYSLMSLLDQLKSETLIIVISHRPAAIKLSDNICLMKDGQLFAQGTYEHLFKTNEEFKGMMEKCAAPVVN